METRITKYISYFLHPLLMPTYGFALILFTDNYISTFTTPILKCLILGITFLFTFLLPTINALILLKMGHIQSLEMNTTKERIIPYGSTALYYFALFYLFYNAEFPAIFKIVILGGAITILISSIINYRWKISAHMIGIGGIAGVILGCMHTLQIDMHNPFMVVIFLSGMVAYARLKLQAHTPSQVYTGFLLGFLIEFSLMLFY